MKKIFAFLGILAVLALAWYWFATRNGGTQQVSENLSGALPPALDTASRLDSTPQTPEEALTSPEAKPSRDESEVEVIARIFAEKYGSYSNQTEFSGFSDLKTLSTPKMQEWLTTYQSTIRDTYAAGTEVYQGISAKVISLESALDAEKAVVTAKVQTLESKAGEVVLAAKLKDLKIELQKLDGHWLVSGAFWL
ncbi:MAG: hypothetical protein HY453_00735 [Parcubacteria group bacterium]|nr:hypothetical protein [Parcubacteria group bacterium]